MTRKEYTLFQLGDASNQLDNLMKELESADLEELDGELYASVQFVYWKLNRAWNSRHATLDQIDTATDAQQDEWAKMPEDIIC